jgi:hypothetical protein
LGLAPGAGLARAARIGPSRRCLRPSRCRGRGPRRCRPGSNGTVICAERRRQGVEQPAASTAACDRGHAASKNSHVEHS